MQNSLPLGDNSCITDVLWTFFTKEHFGNKQTWNRQTDKQTRYKTETDSMRQRKMKKGCY